MNKKFLSAILFGALMVTSTGTFVSCKDYDDDIKDLQEQINANKKAIDDINALITNGSVITSVTPTANGVLVTLSNKDTFEITNGTAGKNGTVWTIEEDGYWYKDSEKTQYKAVGEAGSAGQYYVPNETTGCFDIYQNGKLIQATTISWKSSKNGVTAIIENGVLKLSGVEGIDGGFVEIALTNELRALVFQPEAYVEGIPAMLYYSVTHHLYKGDKLDSKNEIYNTLQDSKKKDIVVVANKGIEAKYHVNPTNVNVKDLQNLEYATRNVRYVVSRANQAFEVNATFGSFADGILNVKVEIPSLNNIYDWNTFGKEGRALAAKDSISVMALQVVREGKDTITSDYATLYQTAVDDVRIANAEGKHYRYLINTAISTSLDEHIVDYGNKPAWETTNYTDIDTKLVDGKTLDLNTIVKAHGVISDKECIELDPVTYGWAWNFSVVKNYKLGEYETPQEEFVSLNGSVLSTKVYGNESAGAAVGRTPIIRATLTDKDGRVVAVAYIKVQIVKDATPSREPITIQMPNADFSCAGYSKEVGVKDMNTLIYNKVGMDKLSFHKLFNTFIGYNTVAEKVGINKANIGEVKQEEDDAETGTSVKSYKLSWEISSLDLWKNSGKEMTHRVVYYNTANPKEATDSLVVILKANAEDIVKSANIDAARMLDNYWDAAKTATSYNFRTPVVGEKLSDKFELITDPNASFKTINGNLLVSESLSKDAITRYYFCVADMKKIETIGDLKVKFSFAEKDSTTLYAQIYDASTKKFLPETAEVVARITNQLNNGDYTSFDGGKMKSYLQYGDSRSAGSENKTKRGEIAKRLLNTNAMYALIRADQYACKEIDKRVIVSFKGTDHFRANIIRPVSAKEIANGNFIDGKDKIPTEDKTAAEVGTYMSIENLVDLYDWRGRQFSAKDYKDYYYGYYGIVSIVPDLEKVTCDLNGENTELPNTVVLGWEKVSTETIYGKDLTDSKGNVTEKRAQASKYGFVTYYNNGAKLDKDFNLNIPVTIEYAWGTITTTVKAHVAKTEQK